MTEGEDVLTLFLVAAMNPTADVQEPKKDEWTHRVTVAFANPKFTPLTGVKAKMVTNPRSGKTGWVFGRPMPRPEFTKGATVTVTEGDGTGDVWEVTEVGSQTNTCAAVKQEPKKP